MKNKKNHKRAPGLPLVLLIVLMTGALIWVFASAFPSAQPDDARPSATQDAQPQQLPTQSSSASTAAAVLPMDLGNGLVLAEAGGYNGMFMEDGTNELVSGVFMIGLENRSEQDLQYGEITVTAAGETYRFQLSNLPAGEAVILLEQDRMASPGVYPDSVQLNYLAWFEEPMSVHADRFRITGAKGVINVENISDQRVDGDIYVYYKYTADDIFFGGITFRVRIEGGLEPGEIRQVTSGHYDPEQCSLVDVTWYES